MGGFSTPTAAGGITKLSELIIDAAPGKAKDIAELILTAQGDVLYRNAEAARLAADYGVGYNFLHAQNTGVDQPEWEDIQGIVAYMTGAVNVMAAPLTLVIPQPPDISAVVAEDHSGGGHVAGEALTITAPSIADAAEVSSVLIEDCEDAWDEYVQANVTSTADGVTKKFGAASAKMAVADLAAVGRLATEDIGPFDLSPYKYLKAWVRSSVIISSGDISILLDDDAQCISPLKDLDIGDIAADTWTEVLLDMGDTSGLTAIISIGIDMDVDKGIFDFWIDQVRATKGGV
ncbi:hypothetical protein ES707_06345 [subsurface metagenome]